MFDIKLNTFYIKYLSGLTSSIRPNEPMNLYIEKDGISLKIVFMKKIYIKWTDIINISVQDGDTKELSAGKAAAGLLLFGPIGGILGAGMKSSKEMKLRIRYKKEDNTISDFICLKKNIYLLYNRLIEARNDYFNINNLNIPMLSDDQISNSSNLQELDYLSKLFELKEKGILTEEEYEYKKKQIIK